LVALLRLNQVRKTAMRPSNEHFAHVVTYNRYDRPVSYYPPPRLVRKVKGLRLINALFRPIYQDAFCQADGDASGASFSTSGWGRSGTLSEPILPVLSFQCYHNGYLPSQTRLRECTPQAICTPQYKYMYQARDIMNSGPPRTDT
jgi:hypothetical protein